jgi:hypothetical protein
MPNVSFDIFFDKDFINITATRGQTAPKAKPEWKVRSAPKLPPKPVPEDHSGQPRPPQRQKLTTLRQPQKLPEAPTSADKATDTGSDTASQAGDKAKRKPPKLGPRKSATSATPADALA